MPNNIKKENFLLYIFPLPLATCADSTCQVQQYVILTILKISTTIKNERWTPGATRASPRADILSLPHTPAASASCLVGPTLSMLSATALWTPTSAQSPPDHT